MRHHGDASDRRRMPDCCRLRWTRRADSPRIASYQADPEQVGRVLLLYSGGLDTSVMLHWIQERYGAEIVTLTVDLGQPGEDWDVVVGKAREHGRDRGDPRRRPRGVRPRLRAAGDQGQRPLRRRLPAVHGAGPAADRQARRRARPASTAATRSPTAAPARATTRCGSTARSRRSTPRSRSSRRCASGGWAARRRSPTRASTRSRSRAATEVSPVLDRRQPLGPLLGGPVRSRTSPSRRPTTSSSSSPGPRRPPTSRSWCGSASRRAVPVSIDGERLGAGRADRARRPRSAPATASASSTTSRTGSSASRSATSTRSRRRRSSCRRTASSRSSSRRSTRTTSSARSRTAGPTSATPASGSSRCAPTSTPTWSRPTSSSPAR